MEPELVGPTPGSRDQCVILAAAPPHLSGPLLLALAFFEKRERRKKEEEDNHSTSMPSLGGLLKKRRTKDSQTLSSELAGTEHHSDQAQAEAQAHTHTNSNDPNQDGSGASMQPATASQASPHHQGQSNAASINNIINSPANAQGEHKPSSQSAQNAPANAQQKERTTKGKYSQEDFLLQRTLGTGSFGRVHLVQSKHNHRFYAMKVLKKAQVVKMKQIEHTNDERRMLNRVRHPFLVTLWGTWQDSRNLYMVMDFVEGGELFSLLRKSQVNSH